LRFQFRYQRWADVLEWFAKQADLSLVLDAPPPGTFNYSDSREYTPAEAIDLLNGVLQTKGYTLIRRDRMLMVINLKGGLPEGVVPQVPLEELDKRGRFEMVTVRFPIGSRVMDTVVKEITPLLGPQGKAVPLPATAQVQVTDTTGIMRSVQALIQSIAEPAAAAPAAAAETPVMSQYPIKPADAVAVRDALKFLFPTMKASVDEPADQVHVLAIPSEQAMVKTMMDDMRSGNPPDKQAKLETYTVGDARIQPLLVFLRSILPKAIFTLDSKAGRIVAWCAPSDHEVVKQTIAKLRGEDVDGQASHLEIYRLANADPTTLLPFLQDTLPDVKLSIDRDSGNLLAWATPSQHQRLADAIAKLGSGIVREEGFQVETFKLTKAAPASLLPLLLNLAPRAKVTFDPTSNSIVVLGGAEDRKIVQETLTRLQPTQPDQNTPELDYYVFKQQPQADLLAALKAAVPLATLKLDTDGKRLSMIATPSDQAFLKTLIERYEKTAPPEEKNQLVLYPVTPEQKARFQAVMVTVAADLPGIKVVVDAEPNQLAVWAKPEQHETLKGIIDQLRQEPMAVETFKLTKATPAMLLPLLTNLAPRAKVTFDPVGNAIVVLGSTEDRKIVQETLARLQPTQPDQNTPELGYYVFKQQPPADLLAALKAAVPLATLKLDTDGKRLSMIATPSDQAFLKTLIERYEKTAPPEEKNQLVLYPVTPEQKARFQAVMVTVAADLPGIKVVVDAEPNQLAIWAKPEQHETLKGIIDQLRQEPMAVETFKLTKATPAMLLPLLTSLAPHAKVTFDPASNSIVVLANAEDRKIVQETLTRLQPSQPDENTPELNYYVFKQQQSVDLLAVLKAAVPQATLRLDTDGKRLSMIATPNDQAFLKTLIERYEKTAPPEEKNQLVIYPVTPEQKARFQAVMVTAATDLPGIKVVVDADPNQLAIWAKPEQHAVLKGIIDQLRQDLPPENKPQLVVYALNTADPANVVKLLTTMFPSAKLVPEKKTRKIAVWALPFEQSTIATAIQQIDAAGSNGNGAAGSGSEKARSYLSPTTDPAVAIGILEDLLPNVTFQSDIRSGSIIASGTEAEHERIRKAIEDMRVENSPEKKNTTEVYSLEMERPAPFIAFLQSLVPTAKLTLDPDTQDLVVWGTKKDHEAVRDVISRFERNGGRGNEW
jgi:type II secretory pathway component GspD/PulD (secretin)